jgi:hypothetical protein
MIRVAGMVLMAFLLAGEPRYDESGHHAVVYALARLANLSQQRASLLADASQSLDENDSTTAFSFSKLLASGRELFDGSASLDYRKLKAGTPIRETATFQKLRDLPHMVSGQGLHALTEHREVVERWHVERIQWAQQQGRQALADLYFGHYLHYVADSVVHPKDPMLGHAREGHDPDRPEGEKLRIMMHLVSRKIEEYKGGSLTPLTDGDYRGLRARPPTLDAGRESIALAVENHWRPDRVDGIRAVFQKVNPWQNPIDAVDPEGLLDRERAANAAHQVRKALQKVTGQAEPIALRKIVLDANGDPPDAPRPIEHLGIATLVAHNQRFQKEREQSVLRAVEWAIHGAYEKAKDHLGVPWLPPKGPGGVALNPGLSLPDLGDVRQVTLDPTGQVVIDAARGRFALPAVRARSFAQILRTVAAGEVPFVTIGTQASDRPGFARVVLSPTLRGTREGALLLRADLQFKAIFADYSFGDALDVNGPSDTLVRGFPGMGGEWMRFWITCSGLELRSEGGRLVRSRHGMRINSETWLMGEPVRDPAMETYAAKLSAEWEKLSDRIWEFRAVEELALDCALAFWVRNHQVRVNEAIWLIPPAFDHTPDFVPIVASMDRQLSVAGGVALTPEEAARAPGRLLLSGIATALDRGDQTSGSPLLRRIGIGLGVAVAMIAVFAAGVLALWRGLDRSVSLRSAARIWALLIGSWAAIAFAAAPLVHGTWLSAFDRNFLAFLLVLSLPPTLLRFLCNKANRRTVLLGYGAPVSAGALGFGLAVVTVLIVGLVPTPALEWVLTAQLVPANTVTDSCASAIGKDQASRPKFIPLPRSLPLSVRVFEHQAPKIESAGDRVLRLPSGDPSLPVGELQRVRWPSERWIRPGVYHYTVDGEPPDQRRRSAE